MITISDQKTMSDFSRKLPGLLRGFMLAALLLLIAAGCKQEPQQPVMTGLDRVDQHKDIFYAKRLGLITNHTALTRDGSHMIDVFKNMDGTVVTAIFGPEHGITGLADAGKEISDSSYGEIPVYSLYGENRRPTAEMMNDIDMFVFDIQDIGTRYYTYIWTMALSMESAAKAGIPFVVLDRPNPISGENPQGNLVDTAFASFVGLYPVPVRHAMTAGELAGLFNKQGWLDSDRPVELTVIPMANWDRSLYYDQTQLEFVKPSPNMPDLKSALLYPGTCLFEGTNLSEGRGTDMPFQIFGAPWVENEYIVRLLNEADLPGLSFHMEQFTPRSKPGAGAPKYQDELCLGVRIEIDDRDSINPFFSGLYIIKLLYEQYPEQFRFREAHFDRLCGTDKIRQAILSGEPMERLMNLSSEGLEEFSTIRLNHLLYQ